MSVLEGQDNVGDATSLAPPLLSSLSLSPSSAIVEKHVTGGVPSPANANLDAIPADKEDVINVDDDGAMVVAVIAMPDTTGGNDARDVIVLALLLLTRRTLISILLVIHKKSSLNDVDL